MLKKRVIACVIIKDRIVVQSINFKRYLPVGKPVVAVEFLNSWGIDEIILLDISASEENRRLDINLIREVSKKCFVPLTVGGGVNSINDIRDFVHAGADKVTINNILFSNLNLVAEAAAKFGNQCVVVSIDCLRNNQSEYEVYSYLKGKSTGLNPLCLAKQVEALGAGEILLNSVDRDGSKRGYDVELIQMVSDSVKIPIIACGGVGHPNHFLEGIKLGVSAVAASNYFHFMEHSVITLKAFLQLNRLEIRLDTYANYNDFDFDEDGRIAKKGDTELMNLRFKHVQMEVI